MSIPGDQSSYDYNILSNLSDNLAHVYSSEHPTLKELTIENFVLTQLASAKNAGMLPGALVDEIEESIQHLKARSICELTKEELDSVQKALKKGPSDSESGYVGSRSDSPMLSQAQTTRSWVEAFFPTPSPFLPAFSESPSKSFPGLSKQDADVLHRVLEDSGFPTIHSYMQAFSAAKKACPTVYEFSQDQLAAINACLQPAVLASSLQRRKDSKFPIQFEMDNIQSRRTIWLTLTINGQKLQLDTQERIEQCIEKLTQVAQNLSPKHSEFLRDCLLLMASQTLVNPLQGGGKSFSNPYYANDRCDARRLYLT